MYTIYSRYFISFFKTSVLFCFLIFCFFLWSQEGESLSCSTTFTNEFEPGYVTISRNCPLDQIICLGFSMYEKNKCEENTLIQYYCIKNSFRYAVNKIPCEKACITEQYTATCKK